MKRIGIILAALSAAVFLPLCFARTQPKAASPDAAADPVVASSVQTEEGQSPLFPDFNASLVTQVMLAAPHAEFDLHRGGNHAVSVNGQRGDADVFMTLLEHIAAIAYTPTPPFVPQEAPLLVLTIREGTAHESVITFYGDNNQGEYARLIASGSGEAQYGMTDGWRIGTLMLACEGMRIQDKNGKEMPVQ